MTKVEAQSVIAFIQMLPTNYNGDRIVQEYQMDLFKATVLGMVTPNDGSTEARQVPEF